jgi:hypothetical protein
VRKVLGLNANGKPDLGPPFMCCWNDCVELAHEEHKVVVDNGYDQSMTEKQTLTYVFCCASHVQYYVRSHRELGQLPEGYRAAPGLLRY